MAYDTLLYDLDDHGVARISLDQPDTRNALSDELLRELTRRSRRLATTTRCAAWC